MKFLTRYISLILIFIVFLTAVIITGYFLDSSKKLKIFNPVDVNAELVDSSLRSINKDHCINDFKLLSQEGKIVTQDVFRGKVYVADFFFTTCQSICPVMSSQMQRVHQKFLENNEFMILSHTVMPEVDSVPVLAEYARRYNADANKWLFVTGDKKQIYELARKSYFAVKDSMDAEIQGSDHDFIHTENFILVDKNKRIRGFYDGTSTADVDRLIDEIAVLLKE